MAVSEKTDIAVEDLGEESRQYAYKKNLRTALPQLLAVSIKNLLILGYGMTLGFQTILIPAVKNPIANEVLHLDQNEISWISSLNLIVVPVGCAMSGVVTAPLGRRRAMQMVNIPFFIAWLMFHFATTTAHLYGALFLVGLGGGLLEAPVLTYVAEITQPHLRGALTATSSMCIIIGVFTQFLLGLFLYWRTVALVNIIFTILAVVALCFVPESPHWLVSKKRHDDARKSLQWLRGWTTSNMVEDELRDIQALFKTKKVESEEEHESMINKMKHYTKKSFIIPFCLVCYSFFVGHFSGMTTLQVYAVSIFEMLQAPIDKYYATLILGILQIIGSGLCVLLVHYIGKRPLTFFSTLGPGIFCILVACYDYFYVLPNNISHNNITEISNGSISSNIFNVTLQADDPNMMNNPYSWMPTVLLMLLALITHTGIRLLPWILIGEVFSAETRSGGAGLSSGVGYIFNFLTNKIYLSLVGNLSIWGTYGIYGIVCLTGCFVLYFILPETEGKKLKEIQDHFAGIRKMDNKVYRSKRRSKINAGKLSELTGTTNPSFDVVSTQL